MSPRRPTASLTLFAVICAAGLVACGTKAPAITGVTVTVTFPTVTADQLELAVWAGSTQVVAPTRRPATTGAALASPQSVSIFLSDALADQDVTCTATALLAGQPAGTATTGSAAAHLQLHHLVPVEIAIAPGGDDGGVPPAAEPDAEGPDLAPDGDGASDADDAGAGDDAGTDAGSDVAMTTPKTNGAACGTGAECESTLCVDGVCCGSVCTGACESCNQKGAEGTCTPLRTGTPTAECVDQLAASCGFDGTCNGNGGCRRYAAGTPCKAATCQTGTFMPASACDGQGLCVAPNAVSCAPYLCDATLGAPQCRTTCQPGGCLAPAVCTNGSCGAKVLKEDGAGCVTAGDCTSNHCADGVCCGTACTGACVSCNQAGFEGQCEPVPSNKLDPHGVCKDGGAAACKQNGLCNGAGGCAFYPPGATCVAGTCVGRVVLAARTCDGSGTCAPAANVDCVPYRCDPATTACYTSCTSNAQCSNAPKHTCNNANVCQ